MKGKTWGPSSGGYVLNSMASTGSTTSQLSSKSRPSIPEENRWSKSNTSLEKSPFSKPGLHTVTSVPEIGKIFFEKKYPQVSFLSRIPVTLAALNCNNARLYFSTCIGIAFLNKKPRFSFQNA